MFQKDLRKDHNSIIHLISSECTFCIGIKQPREDLFGYKRGAIKKVPRLMRGTIWNEGVSV